MGEVFRAVDTGLNRRVAIKILSEKHRDSPELRQRFVREGRAVAAISHPNVVQVFATGTFDDRPYIAMELLDGTDLGSIIENQGALSSAEAAHAVLDAAQGLAAASKAGLIHRDVKPSNLVRLASGEVKVTDFGLAKPVDPGSEPALTAMGVVVGTPDYIAPEQARGETIDERVDIYALGGTLYFLLTGIPPFRTGRPNEDKYLKVVARHLRNPAPDAAVTNPAVDRELAELCKQMMAKKPGERPAYAELVQRLTGLLARIDPGSVPELIMSSRERSRPFRIPVDPSGSLDGGATVSDGSLVVTPRARLPAWLVVVSLLSIGLFVAGLVVYMQSGDLPAETARDAGVATEAGDAGATAVVPADAAVPTAPPGMILVTRDDGSTFAVDDKPVTLGDYRAVFADHKQMGGPDDPVTGIKYDDARAFARTKGRRLVRSDEWLSASTKPGFMVSPQGLLEWVEPLDDKVNVRQHGKALAREKTKGHKDVTFRMVKDI
jgi:eukaryotic-like serine/threonine-protein kinase